MGKGYHGWLEGTNGTDTFDLTAEPYSFFGYTKSGLGYHVETGDGDDVVYGTEHNDWINGQGDDDHIYANDGDDDLYGGGGEDDLFGLRGHDHMYGEADNDTLEGGGGNDHMDGGSGDDTLYGDNFVYGRPQGGNPGNDYLFGSTGNDTLFGQDGTDTLRGGTGRDTLTGGAGGDTFRFDAADLEVGWYQVFPRAFVYRNNSVDTIKDFDTAGGDILDVASILDTMTSFAGATASDAVSQGYLTWVEHGTIGQPGFGTTLYIDPNGSAANTLRNPVFTLAELEGVQASQLTAAQFDVIV
jgi:Ca2+-binding RTX toxin-like protein